MLETLLGSRLRAKILTSLFKQPEERYYVRQLASSINEDATNVSRELLRLEKIGILVTTREGKQKYYQANRKSPVFNELHALMKRTSAITPATLTIPTSRLDRRLKVDRRKLTEFCRLNHIRSLSLFGSVLRDDFKPESDIDVLVEFLQGKAPGFLKLAGMEEELAVLMGGRKVDLRTKQDLSRHFRDRVLKEAKLICR